MRSYWDEAAVPAAARQVAASVLDGAFRVHRVLGPGYLESVYRRSLAFELRSLGHVVAEEVWLAVRYRDLLIERAHRADLVVDEQVLVEVKAVEQLHGIHAAQVVSYLKSSQIPVGLLINFNVRWLRNGFDRFVHPDLLSDERAPTAAAGSDP